MQESERQNYSATSEKASKGDLEWLKAGLKEAGSSCHLIGALTDNDCEPVSLMSMHYHPGK